MIHIIAAKAVSFKEALSDDFKLYQEKVIENTQNLCKTLIKRDYNIVSGGTDNHLFLIDLRNKGITGKVAEKLLGEVDITVNKNTVPKETESPFVTSGVRIGTAAVTTRGMNTKDMEVIAEIIDLTLTQKGEVEDLKKRVAELAQKYPLF